MMRRETIKWFLKIVKIVKNYIKNVKNCQNKDDEGGRQLNDFSIKVI